MNLLEEVKVKYNLLSEEAYVESRKLLKFLEGLTLMADRKWLENGREEVNIFLKKMNFDKTGLKIKSKLTPVLFPELSLLDYFKSFIKFGSYMIKSRFKN